MGMWRSWHPFRYPDQDRNRRRGVRRRDRAVRPAVRRELLLEHFEQRLMLTGPQFDYWSGTSAHTGQAYSENTPMGIEASRNQIVRQFGNVRARKNLVGTIATTDTIAAALNPEGTWNHFEIIARGPVMMHFINGQLTAVLVDDDPASSNNWSGFFGFEIENTTRFEAKNVYVRKLN